MKKLAKFLNILGTLLLTLGTVFSAGMAVVSANDVSSSLSSSSSTVSSSSASSVSRSSSQSVAESSKSNSSEASIQSFEDSSSRPVISAKKASSNQSIQSVTESSKNASSVNSSTSTSSQATPQLAASTSSTNDGIQGQVNIYDKAPYRVWVNGQQSQNPWYEPHFVISSNNDQNGQIAYCYNYDYDAPDEAPGNKYNQYEFYNGMSQVVGNAAKKDEVAAALEGGYHYDKTSGTYSVAPQFQSIAENEYNQLKANGGKDNNGNVILYPGETLDEFEEDVTQSVIWEIGGAPSSTEARELEPAVGTTLGTVLYNYAMNHPLNQQTAEAKDVQITDAQGTIDSSNPLVIDSKTHLSQKFELNNFNGSVDLSMPAGYELVDANTGKVVTTGVESGHWYQVKYTGNDNPTNTETQATVSYERVAESHYFSAVQKDNPTSGNPYQNMVNLETELAKIELPLKLATESMNSSSSSSVASSSSASKGTSSSVASSSSASKSTSSSAASSSSASKGTSSSIASSSSASKGTSSATVSSSSASKGISSTVASSNSASKGTSSSVISSSKASRNTSSTVASSESNKTATNHGVSSSLKQGAVVVGNNSSSNHHEGSGQGTNKGEGHGLPQTGEAISAGLIAIGIVLVLIAGAITLKKRN